MRISHNAAFTLLEMAMVLTIFGLIVGAVFAGQSLIRSSELNAVMKDANNYIFAVNSFKQQYRYLPGDFATATSYWSGVGVGDGNGQISGDERFYAWRHLYLAGYISEQLSGAQGSGGATDFTIGTNVPKGRLSNSGYSLYYSGSALAPVGVTTSTYALTLGNMLTFGASAGSSNGPPIWAKLTPTEASNLDTKADDGIPGTGKWVANITGPNGAAAAYNFGGATACVTGTSAGPGTYDLSPSHDVQNCSFFIKTGY